MLEPLKCRYSTCTKAKISHGLMLSSVPGKKNRAVQCGAQVLSLALER